MTSGDGRGLPDLLSHITSRRAEAAVNGVRLGITVSLLGVSFSFMPLVIGAVALWGGAESVYQLITVGNGATLHVPLSLVFCAISIPVTLFGVTVFRRSIRQMARELQGSGGS